MPSLEVENYGVAGVATVDSLLSELLLKADTLKPTASIDPALEKADFEDLPARLARALAPAEEAEELDDNGDSNKARRFAIIETAARDKFSKLIVS
jgi:THO complex subunit 1